MDRLAAMETGVTVMQTIDIWAEFPTGRRAGPKARAFAACVERELAREYGP